MTPTPPPEGAHDTATAEALDRLAAAMHVMTWNGMATVDKADLVLALGLARRAEMLIGLLVFTNADGERICRGCGSWLDAPVIRRGLEAAHWMGCPFKAALAATPDADGREGGA